MTFAPDAELLQAAHATGDEQLRRIAFEVERDARWAADDDVWRIRGLLKEGWLRVQLRNRT